MTTIPNIPFPEGRIVAGIYAIVNTVNGKLYIGSSVNVRRRWAEHKRTLNAGVHSNSHLLGAWRKYGEQVFDFKLIEKTEDLTSLIKREQHWIDLVAPYKTAIGYNMTSVAGAPPSHRRNPGTGMGGYKGVSLNKRLNQWYATIKLPDSVQVNISIYESPEDAAKAFDSAAAYYFGVCGDLVYYNFPENVQPKSIEEIRREKRAATKTKMTSRFKGVFWSSESQTWAAFVKIKRRSIRLGVYDSEEAAAKVADSVLLHLHNDRSILNFPETAVPRSLENVRRELESKKRGFCPFIGVYFSKPNRNWVARIYHQGKAVNLGRYNTAEEAATVFDYHCLKIRGEAARLNFPHLKKRYLKETIDQILQKGIQLELDLGL